MQTKNNKLGRRRKVFKQVKAYLSFTGKAVTAHAGMAIVSRALDAFGIRDQLNMMLHSLDAGRKFPTSAFLQQLMALKILGGNAISDTAILDEPAIKAMFGWEMVAHPITFARRLKSLTWLTT